MFVRISFTFCLYVFESCAAPTPSGFTTRVLSLTHLQADHTTIGFVHPVLDNLGTSSRQPRDLNDASDELQPIPNAFFPKYGIVLLILFIVICALASAVVIITLHSGAARAWIDRAPCRLYALVASIGKDERRDVQKDTQKLHHDGTTEKTWSKSLLDISPEECAPSSSYHVSTELTDKAKDHSNEDIVASISSVPVSLKSVHYPTSSHKRSPSKTPPQSTLDPDDSLPLSPRRSPLIDHLQALLLTSKKMFQYLTADLTSRQPPPHPPSPNITVTVDICAPPESKYFIYSSPTTRANSDDTNVMKEECDLGCQDIASLPASAINVTMLTQQSPLPISTTHSSPSINSRSGFYSISGDAQMSASVAFHSFVDLGTLVTSSDTTPDTIPASEPSDDVVHVTSILSPRYIHGLQLETIHEEFDGQVTSLASAPSTSVVQKPTHSKPLLTQDTSKNYITLSYSWLNSPTSVHKKDPENLGNLQSDSTPYTENAPNSWTELTPETFTPSRFFPAARPPPPPSDPSSHPTPQVVSALRSPERQETRRSVAWLQPVIDWAVDHPGDDSEGGLEGSSPDDSEGISDIESDPECAAALHSADAMAAVMDSLAAIGLDPTDMGLVTGEEISSSLSNSSFHAPSPSLTFFDPETFRSKLRARSGATASDLLEEEEVETEIVALAGYSTPQKSLQLDISGSSYDISTENHYNRRLYQDQQQGESIKTALVSLLPPSSSHLDPGENEPGAQGKFPNNPVTPSRTSRVERNTPRRDKSQIRSEGVQDLNVKSKRNAGRALYLVTPSPVVHNSRALHTDRVYASPSSLAGLSPIEVAKKISAPSISSAASTPSPSGNCAASPLARHPTSVSPSRIHKATGISNFPSFDCAESTLTSSPPREAVSPSSRSRTSVSSRQRWQQGEHSALGSTKSTPMLSLPRGTGFLSQFSSSPMSPLQRQKPPPVSALGRPGPILIERTNSMEFGQV